MLNKSLGAANSPAWASPEVLAGGDYTLSNDTYAYGIILWEILTLQEPWGSDEDSGCQYMQRREVQQIHIMNKVRYSRSIA